MPPSLEPLSSASASPVPVQPVISIVEDVDSDDPEVPESVVPSVVVENDLPSTSEPVLREEATESPQPVLYTLDDADLSALEGMTPSSSRVSSEAPSDVDKPKKKKSKHKDKDEKKRKKKVREIVI